MIDYLSRKYYIRYRQSMSRVKTHAGTDDDDRLTRLREE